MGLEDNEHRLQFIEARLQRIEKKLNLSFHDESQESTRPRHGHGKTRQQTKNRPLDSGSLAISSMTKPGSWLGAAAVFCFVFAAGFIIKLSIESGWLTPLRQVTIASVFGGVLITCGFLFKVSHRAYASYLPAAGIIILYMSSFAAHRIFDLMTLPLALTCVGAISLLCIWIYANFKHDIYAVTAGIGAYFAPLILNSDLASSFTLYYFLCCTVAFAWISVWVQSRTMACVAAYMAILSTAIVGSLMQQNRFVALLLAVHFIVYSLSVYAYSTRHTRPLSEVEAWAFFPVLLLFYGVEYYFISQIQPSLAPCLSLIFAAFLLGLYFYARHRLKADTAHSQSVIFAFCSIVLFHSVYLELLPLSLKSWLLAIILLTVSFSPKSLFYKKNNSSLYVPFLSIGLIVVIEYIEIVSNLLQSKSSVWVITAAAGFIGMCTLFIRLRDEVFKNNEVEYLFLAATHLLAISGLYRIAEAYGSLLVSICWLSYSLFIMVVAYSLREQLLAKSALLVLGLAAVKALLYDAASTPTVVRIVCLVMTGVVLYGAGILIKKISNWPKEDTK